MNIRKLYLLMLLIAAVMLGGCSRGYDDTKINDRLDELEDRIEKLEDYCEKLNSDIASLRAIVEAMEQNDYVVDITAIVENGVEVGYAIELGGGEKMNIYHGRDGAPGEPGKTPLIGVREDEDGCWYWTLDGEWMLDENGKKVKARGEDAPSSPDTIPQLKIEDGYWYVSYDQGGTWQKLGRAVVEEAQSLFVNVTYDVDNVYFTLYDGTTLTVPRLLPQTATLDITFDTEIPVLMDPYSTVGVGYAVESEAENIIVEVASSMDMKARIVPADKLTGNVLIQSGSIIDEFSHVLVIVSDGSRTVTRRITFVPTAVDVFDIYPKNLTLTAEGGKFEFSARCNVGCNVTSMPDWVKEVTTYNDNENHAIVHVFRAEPNVSGEVRIGEIAFCNERQESASVSIKQVGEWDDRTFLQRTLVIAFASDRISGYPHMREEIENVGKERPGKLELITMHCKGGLDFGDFLPMTDLYHVSGYPVAIVNGMYRLQNYTNEGTIKYWMEKYCDQAEKFYPSVSGISLESSVEGRELDIDVMVFLKAADSYKITLLAVEDNIIAYQEGASDDYVHDGVVRMALSDILGEPFETSVENSIREFSYKVTVPEDFNLENMRLVAYVHRVYGPGDYSSLNFGDYYIDNCASAKVGEILDVEFAE